MAKSLLGERYELLDHLGSGGMATVWRGRDRRLHREVAVKILSEQLASNEAFRARFEREAMHVASLKHPNVVTIYDYGSEGATYYIVMELVEGESLQSRLDATSPYLGLELTLRLTGEALAGLSHAHLKGIIHRDLKPANILITHEETAKLADFGIARAVNEVAGLTTTGSFIGTPSYSSPEQLSGLPATVSSDIYSLGCVLYECLTGRPPFEAELPAGVMAQHLQAVPRPPRQYRSEIPLGVEGVVLKALEKDPALRFATANDMGRALTDGIVPTRSPADNRSTVVRPDATPPSADGPGGPRRHRRRLTLLAIGGAMALVAAAVAIPLVLLAGGHSGSGSPTSSATSTASSLAACESVHQLSSANGKTTSTDGTTTTFSSCASPAPSWANKDGFSQLTVKTVSTGLDEASGASLYDLIAGPCQSFKLAYGFGTQGVSQLQPEFVIPQGSVTQQDHPGSPFSLNSEQFPSPPPYPFQGQVLYLHNDTQVIEQASCLS